MRQFSIPTLFIRVGGGACALAGILLIAGFILHPAGEDATFGTNPFWIPAHSLLWMSFTIALLGWVSLHMVQESKAGSLGVLAFIVAILGTSFASWIFSSDVTFVPVIAAKSPGLFTDIFTGTHVLIGVSSVLTWILGNILTGSSVVLAKVFPKWAGLLLAIGSIIIPIAYLTGLSERVVALGAAIAGAGQIWLGLRLSRISRGTEST